MPINQQAYSSRDGFFSMTNIMMFYGGSQKFAEFSRASILQNVQTSRAGHIGNISRPDPRCLLWRAHTKEWVSCFPSYRPLHLIAATNFEAKALS